MDVMGQDPDRGARYRSIRGAREAFTDGEPTVSQPDEDEREGRRALSPSQCRAVKGLHGAGWSVPELMALYEVGESTIRPALVPSKRRRKT
jgi:hypothetical protein